MMDTILVLGGGFFPDGSLTNLSRQRLDAAAELFRQGAAPTVTVLGGVKSTYLPGAIAYDKAGADKRADYMEQLGVPRAQINIIRDGRDTIGEALACRRHFPSFGIHAFLLVTSALHMPRAAWLFSTILGPGYTITPHGVECGGLLLAGEEAAYLDFTRRYFGEHPGCLDVPEGWHDKHPALYAGFKAIHDRFHPPGRESEAYCAVQENGKKAE